MDRPPLTSAHPDDRRLPAIGEVVSKQQRDVQQVVTLLRELVARQAMGHCERYDADADAFYAETHLIAPGRSIPPAMNAGDAYERERQEKWEAWTKARSARWTQAMADAADLLSEAIDAPSQIDSLERTIDLADQHTAWLVNCFEQLSAALKEASPSLGNPEWIVKALRLPPPPVPDAQKARRVT